MNERTMLICMCISRKFLIMTKVIIMLLYLLIMIHMLCPHQAPHMFMIRVGLCTIILFLVHLGKFTLVQLLYMYQMCNASFVLSCKNAKVVARKLGSKCKGGKTCIWVPKVVVTNLVGPNKSWVPKTQA
jgi:hypothetical protein